MARRGARVTGVDFSANSIDYARTRDMHNVEYRVADYLEDDLPTGFDIAVLIYCDYCVLSPADRLRLLGRISDLLAPGGHLVLDLNGPGAFDAVGNHLEIEERLWDDFFAAGDYVGVHKTDVYADECLSLDRFVVIEPGECWQLFNWTQYYTPESAVAELAEAVAAIEADRTVDAVVITGNDAGYDRMALIGELGWTDYEIRTRVKAIDKAGNEIIRVGKYGNEDCQGGGGDKKLEGTNIVIDPEIPLARPSGMAVYKDWLFLSDMYAHRVLRCKLKYAEEKEVTIR